MENFEKWINNFGNEFNDDVKGLFHDSLRCFKNNIMRPSYLLAYQGMLLALNEKILAGNKPDGFEDSEWEQICKEISNENKWDECTYNRVVQKANPAKGKPAVLCMPDSVRFNFEYWRNLRNVCAHYKDFEFKPAHVLTLYAFIESNIMMISVEGGAHSLCCMFEEYCDSAKHSQKESLTPLMSKISSMVELAKLRDFLKDVIKIVARSSHRDTFDFIKELLFLNGENNKYIRETTANIIHDRVELRNRMIDQFPNLTPILLTSQVEVREYWHKNLMYSSNPVKILAELLQPELIQSDDQKKVFSIVLEDMYKHDSHIKDLSDVNARILKSYGYFDYFVYSYINADRITTYPGFKDINYKTNFYIDHLKYIDPDKQLVERFIEIFDGKKTVPYTLRDRIRDEIWSDMSFRKEFEAIAAESGISIPGSFLK